MFSKNQIFDAEIISVSSDGSGICKPDGYTVFVPFTAVGDVVRVKLLKANKSYGYGKVEQILTESPDRVKPECDAFGKCGGCDFRHINYSAQLKIKRDIVKSAFKKIGGMDICVKETLASEKTDMYRNKAQYPFCTDSSGKVAAGFFAKRSHRVVTCDHCKLQPQIFSDILKFTAEFANENKISAYNEKTHSGILRNLYIRAAEATGEIMVCLVAIKEHPSFVKYAQEIRKNFSDVASVMLNINPKNTNVILGEKYKTLAGKDYVTDIICSVPIDISAPAFYQINKSQAQRLYSLAARLADLKGNETLVDLYCGTGTIGLSMASKLKKLIGVEIVSEAVLNARKNAERAGINNSEFICADASDAAKTLLDRGERPDVVVLDPPRKGCFGDCIEAVCKMAPERIVMISCNPATAARDCAEFYKRGYAASEVYPVDMFPHTVHTECVVKLTKIL